MPRADVEPRERPAFDGYALVAGVSRYRRIRTLPAVRDVEDVADVLRDPTLSAYPPAQVQVLTEESATRSALLDGLDRLRTSAHAASSVFLYFSGHGGHVAAGPLADCYLMPYDGAWANPDDLARTAISGRELSERLRSMAAKRITVVLDCCRAAGIAEPKGKTTPSTEPVLDGRLPPAALASLGHGRGRAVLAASRAEGVSFAVEGRRNSVFTQHLLEGLRGGAGRAGGVIRVCDLFQYVQEKVTAEFPEQHPVFKADIEENYPVSLRQGGRPPSFDLPASADGARYDGFVSYRRLAPDRAWVEGKLVPQLEALGLRLCLAHRDFRLGAPRIREMERAVRESRYTMAVFSNSYLSGAFEDFQALIAQHESAESREPRFIPLIREDCPLSLGVRATERLDVSDDEFDESAVRRLALRLREPYRMNFSS